MARVFNFDYIYLIPLGLSCIVGCHNLQKRTYPEKIFTAFLLTTLIVEFTAIIWKWELYEVWTLPKSNLWLYNSFITVRHIFLSQFFCHVIRSDSIRKGIRVTAVFVLIFGIINYFYLQTPWAVNSYTIVVANTVTIFLVFFYFRQLLKQKHLVNLSSSPIVWICVGTLFYYSGTLPFFLFFNYLAETNNSLLMSYLTINDGLNFIMYSSFLTAFLCNPRPPK